MKHFHSYYQQIPYKKYFKRLVCQMKHSHSYYQQIPYTKYFKRQKQPFADDLQNRCSKRFCNIHRKTPVLESLFNNVPGLKVCNFIRKRLHHRCFLVVNIAKFLGTAFIEHLWWLLLKMGDFLFK